MSLKASPPLKVQKAVEALLTHPGSCTPALRRAVEAHAAQLSGRRVNAAPKMPEELVTYVNKVTLYAYKVTDQDVQQLKEAGYAEDAIFEITLCATVGASLARLQRGLAAMNGETNAPTHS
jgi:hypothetical protein